MFSNVFGPASLSGSTWSRPRLLGPYEPVLLGWTSRRTLLGPHQDAITVNGLFRPFALVRGHAAATWSLRAGRVVLAPFGSLAPADTAALETDAADVVRFLGEPPPSR